MYDRHQAFLEILIAVCSWEKLRASQCQPLSHWKSVRQRLWKFSQRLPMHLAYGFQYLNAYFSLSVYAGLSRLYIVHIVTL